MPHSHVWFPQRRVRARACRAYTGADMKLHWGPNSPFVRKVMIAAHETGAASRITLVRSLVAMNKANPQVMRDNPLSKIPTLTTDSGEVLFDSDVICHYLDSLHSGPRLVPAEGAERWTVLRWNALGSGALDALVLWRNERMRPPGHASAETLLAYEQKIAATLRWIEERIEPYGEQAFGLGHIAIGCMFGYLDLRFADALDWRADHPRCARWFEQIAQRESFRRTEPAVADALVPPLP